MGNEVDNLEDQWVSGGIAQNINFENPKCVMSHDSWDQQLFQSTHPSHVRWEGTLKL